MSYKERLESNNADLQTILDKVNNLPDAGKTQTVMVANSSYDGFSFSYFSPNYPEWVTVAPGRRFTDEVSDGAIYGIIYDAENLSPTYAPTPERMLYIREGLLVYPSVVHDGNTVRLFIAQAGTSVEIFVS